MAVTAGRKIILDGGRRTTIRLGCPAISTSSISLLSKQLHTSLSFASARFAARRRKRRRSSPPTTTLHFSTSTHWSTTEPGSTTTSNASTTSAASISTIYPTSHQPTDNRNPIIPTKNFISNTFLPSDTTQWLDLCDPATNNLVTRVPQSTSDEISAAIASAAVAFTTWRNTTLLHRQQIMFRFVVLIRENWDRLAASITLEQGKTVTDAKGDVLRGLQVAETACGITTQALGEVLDVSVGMETKTYKEPLGVVAAICPFNFPAMIPLWSIPLATITGNTIIVKPSERDPGASLILGELAREAGFPPGVINIIHGSHSTVNALLDSPVIKAISFVGSNAAGEYIYKRAAETGKRCQANLGAKNHAIVMPDCDIEHAINGVVGAAFGAAGQRCMALSTVVFVDGGKEKRSKKFLKMLKERAEELIVNGGFEEGVDVGPMISPEAVRKVEGLVERAVKPVRKEGDDEGGAELVLDGRGYKPEMYPDGNWLAPTILSLPRHSTTAINKSNPIKNIAYTTELFAPVLCYITVPTLESAINLVNANPYGNGTAIYTTSGPVAAKFQKEIEAGQVGVNVGIPVPLPMFSFSGNKKSVAGGGGQLFYGKAGINFYTQVKTVTSYWNPNLVSTESSGFEPRYSVDDDDDDDDIHSSSPFSSSSSSSSTTLRPSPIPKVNENGAMKTVTTATPSPTQTCEAEALFNIIDDSSWSSRSSAADTDGMVEKMYLDRWRMHTRDAPPRLNADGTITNYANINNDDDDYEAFESWKRRMMGMRDGVQDVGRERIGRSGRGSGGDGNSARTKGKNFRNKSKNRSKVDLSMPTHF